MTDSKSLFEQNMKKINQEKMEKIIEEEEQKKKIFTKYANETKDKVTELLNKDDTYKIFANGGEINLDINISHVYTDHKGKQRESRYTCDKIHRIYFDKLHSDFDFLNFRCDNFGYNSNIYIAPKSKYVLKTPI
jgi:hypothetical protein